MKPSPQTPTIVEHIASIFSEAGLPENVIQYFHAGSPTTIESLVRDPKVSLVCFTGSVAGGLAVQKAAADRIVGVGLELGGKDPAYVRADVDIAWAAEEIVDGAIFNSGQSCCSLERIYVDEKIHDAFVEAVQNVLKGYKLGDPFDKATVRTSSHDPMSELTLLVSNLDLSFPNDRRRPSKHMSKTHWTRAQRTRPPKMQASNLLLLKATTSNRLCW